MKEEYEIPRVVEHRLVDFPVFDTLVRQEQPTRLNKFTVYL